MRQLLCGAAKQSITPWKKMFPMVARGKKMTLALDEIFVRVIALKVENIVFLLVSFDLTGAPNATMWVPEISAKFGIPAENILYFATHTHAVPVCGFGNKPAPDDAIGRLWHDALMRAVQEAIDKMQPARFGYGERSSYLNVNRNVIYRERDEENRIIREYCGVGSRFDGPSDKTLAVVRFENLKGETIAFFINYPMHLVAMHRNRCGGDGAMAMSSDIGGLACQYMEERFHGAVAMWSSGAAGDQNPVMMNRVYYPSVKNGEMRGTEASDYDLCLAQAARHFDEILLVNDSIIAAQSVPNVKSGVGYSRTPARKVDLKGDTDPLGRNAAQYVYTLDTEETYDVRIQLIQLGNLALVGISGELYSSIGSLMKEVSPVCNTVIITHVLGDDGVYSGYIFDDEGCTMGGNGGYPHFSSRMLPGYVPAEMCRVMLNLMRE